MAKKAPRRNERERMNRVEEVIAASTHRVREEAAAVDVAVTIVGTGGKGGRVLGDFGTSSPVAAMAVVYQWLCDRELEYGEVPVRPEETDDDE